MDNLQTKVADVLGDIAIIKSKLGDESGVSQGGGYKRVAASPKAPRAKRLKVNANDSPMDAIKKGEEESETGSEHEQTKDDRLSHMLCGYYIQKPRALDAAHHVANCPICHSLRKTVYSMFSKTLANMI